MNRPDAGTRRKLLSRSAFVFSIRAVPALVILLANVLIARRLPEATNGIYQKVWVYLAVLVAIGAAGIPALAITHSTRELHRWIRGFKARHAVLYLIGNLVLGLGLILALRASGINRGVLLALYLCQLASLLSETYLVLRERFRTLVAITLIYTAGFAALHIGFLNGAVSMNALFMAIAGLLGGKALLQGGIGINAYLRERTGGLKRGLMPRAVKRQWLQLGLYDISQLVFRYVDKLLITWLVGPAAFAVYFVGTMDIPFLPLLLGAAGTALLRQLAGEPSDTDGKLRMMQFSGTMLARIVFPVFGFLFVFRSELILGIFGEKYAAAVPLFAISVLAIPLRAYNFTALLQHLNQVRLINIGAGLDLLLALVLALVLYPFLGLPGVAVAFTVCSYVQAAFYLYHTARLLRRPVLDLIPASEWVLLLVVYVAAELSFRSAFSMIARDSYVLIWGGVATLVMIGGSLYTVRPRKPG